jgi:hypothetical protein
VKARLSSEAELSSALQDRAGLESQVAELAQQIEGLTAAQEQARAARAARVIRVTRALHVPCTC